MMQNPVTRETSVTLAEALLAMDALNSWVRSPSFRRSYYAASPRKAVYWHKQELLRVAADAGLVGEARAVVVYLPCRTCGGTGLYQDWYDRSETCRRCQGQRNVRLDFVETTLCLPGAPDRVWHTPDQLCPIALLNLMPTRQPVATTWEPNQLGHDLTVPEAAHLLMTVEDYKLPFRAGKMPPDYGYSLWIGRREGTCGICREDATDSVGHHCSRRGVQWVDQACAACREKYAMRLWEAFPIPEEFTAAPDVQRWWARRQEQTK